MLVTQVLFLYAFKWLRMLKCLYLCLYDLICSVTKIEIKIIYKLKPQFHISLLYSTIPLVLIKVLHFCLNSGFFYVGICGRCLCKNHWIMWCRSGDLITLKEVVSNIFKDLFLKILTLFWIMSHLTTSNELNDWLCLVYLYVPNRLDIEL